ncbi:MAG: MBL fold metallo-hydrolase, partial [Thermoplasmata archaeon]
MGSAATSDFTIDKLGSGVYAAIARPGGVALSNSTIVDLGDATVLFDSMLTPTAGAALARAARRLTGRAPDFVVDSHYHHDHVWGNGAAHPVHVVASRRTRDLLARRGHEQFISARREFRQELPLLDSPESTVPPRERAFYRGWFRGVLAMPSSFRVRLPDVTFEEEMVLHGSRRELRLITQGGGHSPSDVYGYLEDEHLALLGDLVVTEMHPSLGDGFPREWVRILGEVRRLRPERIVPGHGPVGKYRDITTVEEYIRDLTRLVDRTKDRRQPVEIPERYRDWSGSTFFESNVSRIRWDT